MLRNVVLAMVVVSATACSSSFKSPFASSSTIHLDRALPVAIATPKDGEAAHRPIPNSGKVTAQAVRGAFGDFASSAEIHDQCADAGCLRDSTVSASGSSGYLVVPEILGFEGHATDWSVEPDRVAVRITVYDRESGRELDSEVLSGPSRWALHGEEQPDQLLHAPLKKYVRGLYRG